MSANHVIHVDFGAHRREAKAAPQVRTLLIDRGSLLGAFTVRAAKLRKRLAELDAERDSTKSELDQLMRVIGESV